MADLCLYLITLSLIVIAYNLTKFNKELKKKKKFYKNFRV